MKKLNRREFLKLAVATAAGIVASQIPDMEPVKEAKAEVAHAVTYDDIGDMLDAPQYRLSFWKHQGNENLQEWAKCSVPWLPGQLVHIDVDGEMYCIPAYDSIGVAGIVK